MLRPNQCGRGQNLTTPIDHRHELEPVLFRAFSRRHSNSASLVLRRWVGFKSCQ
jgi:hypothetical protein